MLDGDEATRRKVDEAVLTRKAIDWRYDANRAYRRGAQDSPLELEEIVFGMRCSHTVEYFTIVKALADRHRPVKFYEIRERRRFLLGRYVVDTHFMS